MLAAGAAPRGEPGWWERGATKTHSPPYALDRVLVRFRPDALKWDIAAAHRGLGAAGIEEFATLAGLQLVRLPVGLPLAQALDFYRAQPGVLYAEPD